jgi:hypothetical protein
MKSIALIILVCLSTSVFAKEKAPNWQLLVSQDGLKIEKLEETTANGQHGKFNFIVRFTDMKSNKESTQALIKDLQEDWLESHSESSFNDGFLKVTVNGFEGIDKGNGVTQQKPFKLAKCFKLNATSTSFSQTKCD